MTPKGLKSFTEFWPYYVMEHIHPKNRVLHFIGTSLTFVFLGLAITTGELWYLAGMPIAGYGFAWFGHFVIQKNRPATFTYPLWSLRGDYKMYFLTWAGRMPAEIERAVRETRGAAAGRANVS